MGGDNYPNSDRDILAVSLNSARDIGCRLFALTIWGKSGKMILPRPVQYVTLRIISAAGGSYAAIAALVNIPATLLAAVVYELFLVDSDRGPSS
jgi:H+/gluconate symporter-like permease